MRRGRPFDQEPPPQSTKMLTRVFAVNIAANFSSAAEGILTLKYGSYPNIAGVQIFDRTSAEMLVRSFNSDLSRQLAGLPILQGHPDFPEWAKQNPGVSMAALGRVRQLDATNEGLRIRYILNEQGMSSAGSFSSYSPAWYMESIAGTQPQAFRPKQLVSIGLTNKPNIPGTEFKTAGVNTGDRTKAIAAAVEETRKRTGLHHHDAFLATKRSQPALFQ